MRFGFKRDRKLKIATCLYMAAGLLLPSSVFASTTYNGTITGDTSDSSTFSGKVSQSGSTVTYDFKGQGVTSIGNKNSGVADIQSGTSKKTVVINADTLSTRGFAKEKAFVIGDNVDVTVNGDLDLKAVGSKGWGITALGMLREGMGEGVRSDIHINGNVTMRNSDDSNPWAVYDTDSIHGGYDNVGYKGSRWAPVGINLGESHGSTITVNGTVDLAVKGIGVATDPFYPSSGMAGPDLAKVSINGGRIITPEDQSEGYYSLASFGGTINMNMNADQTAATNNKVEMVGNVISMKHYKMGDGTNSGNPYFYQDGRINIGLNTQDSTWKGVIDNSGTNNAGEVNVFLGNGATWTHESPSKTNGLDATHMPEPSVYHYAGTYDNVSHVNNLVGTSEMKTAGAIKLGHSSTMDIAKLSGSVKLMYAHNGDGADKSQYVGGDVIVRSANENSKVSLYTDSTGITVTDDASVTRVLNALASKLTYSAYATGERNLSGNLGIASGLTASSRLVREGTLGFTDGSGVGRLTQLVDEDKTDSLQDTMQIIEDNMLGADQRTYWSSKGIRATDAAKYNFTSNVVLTADAANSKTVVKDSPAMFGTIMWNGDRRGRVDMNGYSLTLNNTGAVRTSAIAVGDNQIYRSGAGIYATSNEVVFDNINSLHITSTVPAGTSASAYGIYVEGTNSRGAYYNGDGNAKVTINNVIGDDHAVTIDLKGDLYRPYALRVDKNSGSAALSINGYVNYTLPTGIGLYVTGGNVSLGGGHMSVDSAQVIQNVAGDDGTGGRVWINATNDDAGNVVGADHKVQLDGQIYTGRNSKTFINLVNGDSYWTGIARTGGEGTEQGQLHLRLGNGSLWTSHNGSDVAGDEQTVNTLIGEGGTVVVQDALPIHVQNYSGNLNVVYSHTGNGQQTTDYSGGKFTIDTAANASTITLITDSTGMSLDTESNAEASF